MGICSSRSAREDGPTRPVQPQLEEPTPGILPGGNIPLKPWTEIKYYHPKQLTRRELLSLREAFWDTQPAYSGRAEIWQTLRAASESESHSAAQTFIDLQNIQVPTGNLADGCYDAWGNQYIIPAYCFVDPVNLVADDLVVSGEIGETGTSASSINETLSPVKLESPKLDTSETISQSTQLTPAPGKSKKNVPSRITTPLANAAAAGTLGITMRLSTNKDIKLTVTQSDTFATLRKIVEEQEKPTWDSEKKKYKLRFFYLGKTVEDRMKIKDTKLMDGGVVQVMVVPIN